jgi:hypothetical protein
MNRHARIYRQEDKDHEEHRTDHDHRSRHRGGTGRQGAPEKPVANRAASPKKSAPKGQTVAKAANTKPPAPKKEAKAPKKAAKPAPAKRTTTPRAESKGAKIIEMIGRAKGATLAEIMKATDWQAHSIRGFLSTAAKKQELKIESAKNEAGERVYRLAK